MNHTLAELIAFYTPMPAERLTVDRRSCVTFLRKRRSQTADHVAQQDRYKIRLSAIDQVTQNNLDRDAK